MSRQTATTTMTRRMHAALAFSTAFIALAGPALAASTDKGCTVAGVDVGADPVFRSTLHPSQRTMVFPEIACEAVEERTLPAGDGSLRFRFGKLYEERVGHVQLEAGLVTIERQDASGARMVGRLFLAPDPIDGRMRFEPQARDVDGVVLVRLSPRHRSLYRLDGDALSPVPATGWRASVDGAFPDDARSGELLAVDLDAMEGRIAVRRIGKDPVGRAPAGGASSAENAARRPPSAFDASLVVVARLAFRNGHLVADSAGVRPRKPGEDAFLDEIEEMDRTARDGLKDMPASAEPCSLGGWSTDVDPKGLNVRAAPSASAKILGTVPPPRLAPATREVFGPEPIRAEFRIIGQNGDWFLIENISAPGAAYDVPYPRGLPQPYKGRGWVNGRMVGGALANGGLPTGRLYVSPHADAAFLDVADQDGNPIGPDTSIRRIHACSGWWALIETGSGQRGWWRGVCSNQVTNCS